MSSSPSTSLRPVGDKRDLVATLISAPRHPALSRDVVEAARAVLGPGETRWLNRGIAVDLMFQSAEEIKLLQARLGAAVTGLPVDVAVQAPDSRRKALLLADMDSTMIGEECIDELAAEAGLKDKVADITRRAMAGDLDFEPALRERVGLLKGLPVAVVDKVIKERITLAPGGTALVATMRANGGYCALVSGGFTVFTSKIAAMIGFDENRANRLIEADGRLTGTVGEPILGRQAKLDTLRELTARLGLDHRATMAVGDGANDLAMIEEAGLGVALHAKPKVAAAAPVRIDHGDLTALLYLQGYGSGDIIG